MGLVLVLFVGSLSTSLSAQEAPNASPAFDAVPPQSSASIAGSIRDRDGVPVAGVQVMLIEPKNAVNPVVTSDSKGAFMFPGLSPGAYRVKISAVGLEPSVSDELLLGEGEKRELPLTATPIPIKTTTVNVVATLNEVAQAQVKQEESQRLIGLLPNYYTSYIWNAAPLTPRLKFNLALRTVTDPAAFVVAAGVAGAEQAHKTFPGYGQELEGYAKRYGGTYADLVAGRMLGSAVFPTIFHQDPRYFYRGSGSIRSRVLYAVLQSVVCRGDNGQVEPNYSHILGSFTAAGLSNLYRSPQDRRAGLTLRNGLIITASGAAVNLMREFLSRKLTPNVPTFANGKP